MFWSSLCIAVAALLLGYRYRIADTTACPVALERLADAVQPRDGPAGGALHIERYRFTFQASAENRETLAISLGEAVPFYRLWINNANLTPEIDLQQRNVRDIGPHLHRIPADALAVGSNVALLELPRAAELGELRLSQVCIGDAALLAAASRGNWWRMVGIPSACVLLFCVFAALALAAWLLSARHPAYAWYFVCLLLMLARAVYVATSARPGTPLAWIALDNIAIALQPYALYCFMRAYWRFSLPWLSLLLGIGTSGALLCCAALLRWPELPQLQSIYLLFLLLSTGGGMLAVAAITRGVRILQQTERSFVLWTGVVAYAGSLLEIANVFLPFEQRWMWTAPPATAVLAMGLGKLLLHRLVLGADLMTHAANVLAQNIDQGAAATSAQTAAAWDEVSAQLAHQERGRLIRDIHDGFGSRLVAILLRARRELPHSSVQRNLQRALLDMRLMIDALDETSRSLGLALACLRHRTAATLDAAGIAGEWQLDAVDSVRIDDRRKLMHLFRCLAELLGNCAEHSGADTLTLHAAVANRRIVLRLQDNGRGVADPAQLRGHGLRRARHHVDCIDGELHFAAADAGSGLHCELRLPLF
ncbi:sensor histidine kinase [Tahibacter aquaticus]|uniref:sensor histidine kinase n=1 Tax=Tahibacter aquaticus TaxID=520092 RepID=UPI001414F474|nr:hypothetical protein [Tahibacter aquaticus]